LRGISDAFPQVEVAFDAMGPGLIAILGENGQGKSTLTALLQLGKAISRSPPEY